jgi:hypothetical protein
MKYLKEHNQFIKEFYFNPEEDYTPSLKLKNISHNNELKSDIENLLQIHVGKRPFFNALDDLIKYDDRYLLALVNGLENSNIISTGSFGDQLYEEYEDGEFDCASIGIFNGKICTERAGIHCVYPGDVGLENKEFVFIDDSLYSGRTVNVIEDYLKTIGSSIKEIRVAYDGSKKRDTRIKSLYRYYDEHPEKLRKDK